MFNYAERIDMVSTLTKMFVDTGNVAPKFKDVENPAVNQAEDYGIIKLKDTHLVIAITLISEDVTITDTDTRKIYSIKVKKNVRSDIISKMLKFDNVIKYR